MYETLRFNEQDGVATITLDRPGGNRISMQMVREISSICDYLEDDSKARVVVFRGAGGAFCAGIDFDDFDPKLIDKSLTLNIDNNSHQTISNVVRTK